MTEEGWEGTFSLSLSDPSGGDGAGLVQQEQSPVGQKDKIDMPPSTATPVPSPLLLSSHSHLQFPGSSVDLHLEVVPSLLLRETGEPVVLRVTLKCSIGCHGS